MKKLNRKGFTLVELLAVIVILAIVVGIAIPGVTSVINNSKYSALGVAVETAVDTLQDQYDAYLITPELVDSSFSTLKNAGAAGMDLDPKTHTAILESLGFDPDNVMLVHVKVADNTSTSTADICVEVKQVPTSSDYYSTAHWNHVAESGEVEAHGTPNANNDNYKKGNTSTACNQ